MSYNNNQIDLFETINVITTLGHSEHGSNCNKEVTPYYSLLWKWSFTTGCSLVSYPEYTSEELLST